MIDCEGIPRLGYGAFSEWLHQRAGNQHIPISGSLEVTLRCNLRCQHCYIPPESRSNRSERELSLVEIERILDEVTDAGCLWFLLTGGEPFLRRDFLDIYVYARQKGLIVTLFTNGTLLNRRIADHLSEWRPFNIEITLYGATQKTYERVTGVPGSYSRCRRGIDLILERNLPLSLKTMVMTINHHELDQMKSLATSLGIQFRFDPILHPAIDGSHRPTFLRLTPREIVALERADPDRARRWPERYRQSSDSLISDRRMYLCSAGKSAFHVDAAGIMYPCLSTREFFYDLRNGNFQEGWKMLSSVIPDRLYGAKFPCVNCDLRLMCAQCPAKAALEHGESEKRVDFLCQIAKLRKDAFDVRNDV